MQLQHEVKPNPDSIRNIFGELCPKAVLWDYPLSAICSECGSWVKREYKTEWNHR